MGKKKEPSINDSLNLFKDVAKRSSTSAYQFVNRNIFSINSKKIKILMNIDEGLWNAIMNDDELKDKFTELDISNKHDRYISDMFKYTEDIENGWVEIDPEKIYTNELLEINIEGFEYAVQLNKTIYPLRFKKMELNNFGYRINQNPLILTIKKTFEGAVPDSSFTIFRVFHII